MTAPGRSQSLLESFNYAFEGIIHVLRTQRNLRIHFAIAVAVIVFALIVNVTKLELIALLLVHGVLHLVGYDHEADNGAMLRRQRAIFEEVEPVAVPPS